MEVHGAGAEVSAAAPAVEPAGPESAASAPIPAAVRRLSLAVQLGSFVVILGISDGALGVLWPSMRASFHLPLDALGLISFSATALYMTGGLAADRLRRRLGLGTTMVVACVVALGGLVAWAVGDWWVVVAAVGLLGLAKGVIDAVLNAEAALQGGVRRLGILHASWAIGGTLGPLLVAAVLAWAHDWRAAVVVMVGGVLLLTPLAMADRRHHPAPPGAAVRPPVPGGIGQEASPAFPAVATRRPAPAPHPPHRVRLALALTVAAFVFYVAAESGPIAWGYTYLLVDRHMSRGIAALAVALLWAALTCGRFGLAIVDNRWSGTGVLEGSCLLMIAGTAILWGLPGWAGVLGLPVIGLGAAAIFPMLVALMPARIGEAGTGRAVGASIAAAGFGGPMAVALFGFLAGHLGVRVFAPCLFASALVLYVVNRLLTSVTARTARGARAAELAAGGAA